MKIPYQILLDAFEKRTKVMSGSCLVIRLDALVDGADSFGAEMSRGNSPLDILVTRNPKLQPDHPKYYTVVLIEPDVREVTYAVSEQILVNLLTDIYPIGWNDTTWDMNMVSERVKKTTGFDSQVHWSKDGPG